MPGLEHDLAFASARHRLGDAAVVEVVGEAHARVRRVERLLARSREEQRVGVGGRSEVVARVARAVARGRRRARRAPRGGAGRPSARAASAAARASPRDARSNRSRRPRRCEHLERALRGRARREHVRRELAVHRARIGALDAHRDREAPRRQQQGENQACARGWRPARPTAAQANAAGGTQLGGPRLAAPGLEADRAVDLVALSITPRVPELLALDGGGPLAALPVDVVDADRLARPRRAALRVPEAARRRDRRRSTRRRPR